MTLPAEPPANTLEATNQGDPNAPSLMEAMDTFFDGPQNAPAEPVTPPAPVSDPPAAPSKASEPTKADIVPEATPTPSDEPIPLIDEGFFKADDTKEGVKDPAAFDEVAFDAQTELEVKGMDAKAGDKWKALKAEIKSLKQAAPPPPPADLLKRVEEAELKAKEAEGLRERLKEASSVTAQMEVENDDVYIAEVKKPYNAVMARLDKLSEVYEMDPSILRSIVRETDLKVQDEMIKTHLANFTDVRRQEVFSAIPRVGELIDRHEEFMNEADTKFATREAKRIEETERLLGEQKKAVQTITQDKWKRWEAVIPGLLDADGQPTADYTKLKNQSLSLDFSQSRASDQAFAALAGTLLPFAQQQIVKLQRQLAQYKKEDKKALAAAPGTGASLTTVPATKPEKDFLSRMAEDIVFTH